MKQNTQKLNKKGKDTKKRDKTDEILQGNSFFVDRLKTKEGME